MSEKSKENFDQTHDSQFIYRKMLEAISRPGTISTIHRSSSKLDYQLIHHGLMGIALTLLDGETSFAIFPESEEISAFISKRTGSQSKPLIEADYILLYHLNAESPFSKIVEAVKKGTFLDPHQSGTLIVLVDSLQSKENAPSDKYILSGPGIRSESNVHILGLPRHWEQALQHINREYPLGIDTFFVSKTADIMSIPRTTLIQKG